MDVDMKLSSSVQPGIYTSFAVLTRDILRTVRIRDFEQSLVMV